MRGVGRVATSPRRPTKFNARVINRGAGLRGGDLFRSDDDRLPVLHDARYSGSGGLAERRGFAVTRLPALALCLGVAALLPGCVAAPVEPVAVAPAPVYVAPAPVAVAPAPVVVAPRPVAVVRPAPVVRRRVVVVR